MPKNWRAGCQPSGVATAGGRRGERPPLPLPGAFRQHGRSRHQDKLPTALVTEPCVPWSPTPFPPPPGQQTPGLQPRRAAPAGAPVLCPPPAPTLPPPQGLRLVCRLLFLQLPWRAIVLCFSRVIPTQGRRVWKGVRSSKSA